MSKEERRAERKARREARRANRKPFFETTTGGILKGVASIVAPQLVQTLEGAQTVGEALEIISENPAVSEDTKIMLRELTLKEYEIEVMDRASAREREIKVLEAGGDNKLMSVLGWGVTLCFILVVVVSLGVLKLPNEINKDYYLFASGAVSSAFMTVLAYYFGSSAGSKQKTNLL